VKTEPPPPIVKTEPPPPIVKTEPPPPIVKTEPPPPIVKTEPPPPIVKTEPPAPPTSAVDTRTVPISFEILDEPSLENFEIPETADIKEEDMKEAKPSRIPSNRMSQDVESKGASKTPRSGEEKTHPKKIKLDDKKLEVYVLPGKTDGPKYIKLDMTTDEDVDVSNMPPLEEEVVPFPQTPRGNFQKTFEEEARGIKEEIGKLIREYEDIFHDPEERYRYIQADRHFQELMGRLQKNAEVMSLVTVGSQKKINNLDLTNEEDAVPALEANEGASNDDDVTIVGSVNKRESSDDAVIAGPVIKRDLKNASTEQKLKWLDKDLWSPYHLNGRYWRNQFQSPGQVFVFSEGSVVIPIKATIKNIADSYNLSEGEVIEYLRKKLPEKGFKSIDSIINL
jgi:hypothetical protein